MNVATPTGNERGRGQSPGRRRRIPFWLLQAAELVVAFVFVDVSVHVGNGGLLVGAAIAFAALSVTAHGPVGLVRICRPWLHVTLLVAVAAVVAVAPLVPSLRPDIEGILVLEFGAIGLVRLATLTEMGPSPRPSWMPRRERPDGHRRHRHGDLGGRRTLQRARSEQDRMVLHRRRRPEGRAGRRCRLGLGAPCRGQTPTGGRGAGAARRPPCRAHHRAVRVPHRAAPPAGPGHGAGG